MEDHLGVPGTDWQRAYQNALSEADNTRLHDRIVVAESAIFNRLQVLASNPHCQGERQLLFDALARLRGLLTEVLGFPEWRTK